MTCNACGEKPKNTAKDFTKAVVEINNPEALVLLRKVVIPVSMGTEEQVPPTIGKYHNVLLYYEANQKSYLYSSDGIPTQLVNGITNYEDATNLPQINGNTVIGNKTGEELGLQDKLTDGDNITIENGVISATDTTYGPATDTEIGLVKPGTGLAVTSDGTLNIVILDYSTSEVNTGATWIDGNKIYKKTISTGALPNNTTSTTPHGISGIYRVIRVEGYAYVNEAGLGKFYMPLPNSDIFVQIVDGDIEITTVEDLSWVTESYVTLYYTKTQ